MYKMNLLSGGLTKSANVVGQTMRLNPHGDSAIYETMVRLARETKLCFTRMFSPREILVKHIPEIWHMQHPVIQK